MKTKKFLIQQISIIFLTFFIIFHSWGQNFKIRIGKIIYTGISIDELQFEAFGEPSINSALIQLKQIKLANYPKSHLISPLILKCNPLIYNDKNVDCRDGFIQLKDNKIAVKFNYDIQSKRLDLTLFPSQKESWHIVFQQTNAQNWQIDMKLKQANLQRLLPYLVLPRTIQFKQGTVDGFIKIKAKNNKIIDIQSNIDLSDINLSDAEGFHAVEHLNLKLVLNSLFNLEKNNIDFSGQLNYISGQAYSQPIYFANGGHIFNFKGDFNFLKQQLNLDYLNSEFKNIGSIVLKNLNFDLIKNQINSLDIQSSLLDFKNTYLTFLQPLLGQSVFGNLKPNDLKGNFNFNVFIQNNAIKQALFQLDKINLIDKQNRFHLNDVSLKMPYDQNRYQQGFLEIQSRLLNKIPIEKIATHFEINKNQNASDIDVLIPNLKINLLGGEFNINDFKLIYDTKKPQGDNIEWQFSANLTPISMLDLTKLLEITPMNGQLSATIPKIAFKNHEMHVDGDIQANLFDGTLNINHIRAFEPFGRVPRLLADIQLKNIDLDLLTRSFSFGNITGKIDIDLKQLELNAWKPVSFDLNIKTSEGRFKKKLSQKAVQNIASLNGGGISSALQRRALGFFDAFSYDKLGLSCEMRFGLCKMTGIEPAENNGYYIIKGFGIPHLDVVGYNRLIDWEDFVSRIQSVIENQNSNEEIKID